MKVNRSVAMTALRMALLVIGTFSMGDSHAAPHDSRVLPLAASVETQVLDALGGVRHLAALHALTATGTLEGLEGFPGTYELIAEAPDRRRETWDIGYLRDTTVVAGKQGWERTSHVRELAGEELSRDRRDAQFEYLYRLIISHTPVSIALGRCSQEVAYLLAFRRPGEPVETFGVDPKTHLPLCRLRTEKYEEGPREVRTTFSDYREVRGLMLPFGITEDRPENTLKITIAKYDLN
ncbi:MAG TPA: hypothetical protein VGR92_17360, partial [Steroidobacteraceae bacterium]|nr:hypothetical protein [Steroidobacteraceae bacterium]